MCGGHSKKGAYLYYASEHNKMTIGSVTLRGITLHRHVLLSVQLKWDCFADRPIYLREYRDIMSAEELN